MMYTYIHVYAICYISLKNERLLMVLKTELGELSIKSGPTEQFDNIHVYTHAHRNKYSLILYETVQEQFCQRDNHLLEGYTVLTG